MDKITWEQIKRLESIKLYAGDISKWQSHINFIGLSVTKSDNRHILHDVTKPTPLEDDTVDMFISEDVFEHIQYERLPMVVDEIYRVLKPKSLFRIAVPDYGCDVLRNRSLKNDDGQIIFDPGGGGTLKNPGHVWFPRIDTVTQLLKKTRFYGNGRIEFLHYYRMDGTPVMKPIDHSKAHIQRTPDFDERVKEPRRPMSLVVDLQKEVE